MSGQAIETARLRLRAPRLQDAPRVATLIGDFEVARMLAGVPHPCANDDAERFIHRVLKAPEDNRVFLIEHGDEVIGSIGLHRRPEVRHAELGFWLARDHWNRGVATEAVASALVWAHRDWGRRAVLSGHFVDNDASARVLAKAGFLYTGDVEPRLCLARGQAVATRLMVWLA